MMRRPRPGLGGPGRALPPGRRGVRATAWGGSRGAGRVPRAPQLAGSEPFWWPWGLGAACPPEGPARLLEAQPAAPAPVSEAASPRSRARPPLSDEPGMERVSVWEPGGSPGPPRRPGSSSAACSVVCQGRMGWVSFEPRFCWLLRGRTSVRRS